MLREANLGDDISKDIISLTKARRYLDNGLTIEPGGVVKQADATVIGKLDNNDVYNPGELKVKGEHSGRHFDPDNGGGPIQKLDWKNTNISSHGISDVEKHLSRFPDSPENTGMIERLRKIEKGEIQATDFDKRFYTHELTEYQRYKNKGIPDGEDPFKAWDDTHTASLEDYQINERTTSIYHPSVEQ